MREKSVKMTQSTRVSDVNSLDMEVLLFFYIANGKEIMLGKGTSRSYRFPNSRSKNEQKDIVFMLFFSIGKYETQRLEVVYVWRVKEKPEDQLSVCEV